MLSGKPMMQTIVEHLTKPLTDKEKYSGPAPAPVPEPGSCPLIQRTIYSASSRIRTGLITTR
jgi:hypothetical protein